MRRHFHLNEFQCNSRRVIFSEKMLELLKEQTLRYVEGNFS